MRLKQLYLENDRTQTRLCLHRADRCSPRASAPWCASAWRCGCKMDTREASIDELKEDRLNLYTIREWYGRQQGGGNDRSRRRARSRFCAHPAQLVTTLEPAVRRLIACRVVYNGEWDDLAEDAPPSGLPVFVSSTDEPPDTTGSGV